MIVVYTYHFQLFQHHCVPQSLDHRHCHRKLLQDFQVFSHHFYYLLSAVAKYSSKKTTSMGGAADN